MISASTETIVNLVDVMVYSRFQVSGRPPAAVLGYWMLIRQMDQSKEKHVACPTRRVSDFDVRCWTLAIWYPRREFNKRHSLSSPESCNLLRPHFGSYVIRNTHR